MPKHNYTAKEAAYIIANYPNGNTQRIANHIGVSLCSLYKFANRNGLKKSNQYLKQLGGLKPKKQLL